MTKKAIQVKSSSTLVGPALVTVVGVAKENQQASSSPDMKARKRQSAAELKTCSAVVYKLIKRRVGRSLK